MILTFQLLGTGCFLTKNNEIATFFLQFLNPVTPCLQSCFKMCTFVKHVVFLKERISIWLQVKLQPI